jgi:four helix bundle protein
MRNYRALMIWKKSHEFSLEIYRLTHEFPRREIYGLTSQIRRASASVPTNIAEGCGRNGNPEFIHFLQIALGSANEVDYQILLSKDLGYLPQADYERLCESSSELRRMLATFIRNARTLPAHRPYLSPKS